MIHHLSISAENPENVAKVLAELMGGTSFAFPPRPGSFVAFTLDEHGTEVEVYPAGTKLQPGADGTEFVLGSPTDLTVTHFAMSVDISREQVFKIAEKQGWTCQRVNRALFPLVEVWLENRTLVEVLPPDDAAIYLEVNNNIRERALKGLAPMGEGKPQ